MLLSKARRRSFLVSRIDHVLANAALHLFGDREEGLAPCLLLGVGQVVDRGAVQGLDLVQTGFAIVDRELELLPRGVLHCLGQHRANIGGHAVPVFLVHDDRVAVIAMRLAFLLVLDPRHLDAKSLLRLFLGDGADP